MVPLSVTQAEQIAAIRGWAADRAVAATSAEDRTGYTTAGPDAGTAPAEKDGSGPQPFGTTDPTTRGEGQRISVSISIVLIPRSWRLPPGSPAVVNVGRWTDAPSSACPPDARRRSADRRSPTPAPWSPQTDDALVAQWSNVSARFHRDPAVAGGPGRSTFGEGTTEESVAEGSPPSTPRTDSGCNRRY